MYWPVGYADVGLPWSYLATNAQDQPPTMTEGCYISGRKREAHLEVPSFDRADAEMARAYDIHPVVLSNRERCLKKGIANTFVEVG